MTFRFETLLRVKRIKENLALQDFAKAQRYHLLLQEHQSHNQESSKKITSHILQKMIHGMKSSDLWVCQNYLSFLDHRKRELSEQLASSSVDLNQKREKLLQAEKELKSIGRLKEIELERQANREKAKEMRFIDEIAITKHRSNP